MARHNRRGVPVASLFAPTMISNSSAEVLDPFGAGKSDADSPEDAATAEIESGSSPAEAVAAAIEAGATPSEAKEIVAEVMVDLGEASSKAEAKAEIKKAAGRPKGSKNKPKPAASVSDASKKASGKKPGSSKPAKPAKERSVPAKYSNLVWDDLDKDVAKKLPKGCYGIVVGKGFGAYCPETGKKYSLKTGEELKPVGRKAADSVSSVASKPASAAKPASAKGQNKDVRVAKAVAELAALTGLRLAPSFRVDYGDYTPKGPKKKEESVKLQENGSEQAKLGPYTLTLLKNPVMDLEIAGVKAVPTLVGTAGTLTLEKLASKGLSYVPMYRDMKDSPAKTLVPTLGVMLTSAALHWYAKKNSMKMLEDASSAMFGFSFVLGSSRIVDQYVAKAVDAITPASTPSAQTAAVVSSTPATGTKGGMFAGGQFVEGRSMNGGAFRSPSMAGYLARSESSGYPTPQLAGSTGYPPVNMSGRAGADSASIARKLSSELSGGAFRQRQASNDKSEFKDF